MEKVSNIKKIYSNRFKVRNKVFNAKSKINNFFIVIDGII